MSDKKRIAVLSSHTPSLFWFRMDMMKEFMARGWEVWALGNESEIHWSRKFSEQGITYRRIDVQRNGTNPLKDLRTLISIKTILQEIKPEKIFAFQAKTIIYSALAANQLGITEVYPLVAGMGSVFLKDDPKTRAVRMILTAEYKASMRKCPVVFFQNRDDEEIFRKYRIVNDQKVVLLHGSGVNIEKFTVTPLPEKPAFLCITRLIRDKGVMEYLEACRLLKKDYPDVRCLLVGPYDTNPSAITPEELQAYLDDGSLEYCGEATDVRPYFEAASVYVLPSYREGTPKTNLEAMACGRAVITTDAPGCRETVVDGENGFLVPVRDSMSIVEKMSFFLEHPDKIAEMGREGRARAEELFDVRKVDEAICEAMKI